MTFVPLITVETERGKVVTEVSENLWISLRVRMVTTHDKSMISHNLLLLSSRRQSLFRCRCHTEVKWLFTRDLFFPRGAVDSILWIFMVIWSFCCSFVSEPNTIVPPFATFVLVAFAGCPGERVNHCKSKKLDFDLIWWTPYFVRWLLLCKSV